MDKMDKLVQERHQTILGLIRQFCDQQLDENYFGLAEKLMNKLGGRRNVPFITGKAEVWAVAVIHALGTINLLFDDNSDLHITTEEINDFFQTNSSTTRGKSKLIRDLLKLNRWTDELSIKKKKLILINNHWTS